MGETGKTKRNTAMTANDIGTRLIETAISNRAVRYNRHGVGGFNITPADAALFAFDKKYNVCDGIINGPVGGSFQVRNVGKRRAAYITFCIDEPIIEFA